MKKPGPKANKDWHKQDVIDVIIKMRTEQMCASGTIYAFLKEVYDIEKSYAGELIKEASEQVAEIVKENNKNRLENTVAMYENMIQEAYLNKDRKLALQIQADLNKLLGLYAAQKVDVTSDGKSITEIKLIRVDKQDETGN